MTDSSERLARFLGFSSKLTAFSVFDLQGTGQAEPYLSTVTEAVGAGVVDELLDAYAGVQATAQVEGSNLDGMLRREILADEKLGPIARNIIKMWYVGIWYQLPAAWRQTFGTSENDFMHMVSPAAYTEGLLWTTIGANPNGAKAPGYGSWAEPPRIPADGSAR
jgi:hypothetical protein